ncbi:MULTISPECIES: hypothetical protein [unclassified Vibrio]|uniref:hypothetical protein n=1 Tax=unclassified Vibrio TaxID=2614977 RepID=UPI0027CF1DDA|nr:MULTISPECIES: hypothetical protein [unclassified Vibrio]MDQ2108609.1 hypothetical protein [Vibrio sp. 2017_1457_15]MDQ2161712.1 hypothetical protein [Vibrio sp. 2017_1457_13]
MSPHGQPNQPSQNIPTPSGGASGHEQSQWIIRSITEFTGEIRGLRADVDHLKQSNNKIDGRTHDLGADMASTKTTLTTHCSDMSDMKSQIDSIKKTIWITSGAVIAAVALITFLLGNSLQDIMTSLEALKSLPK